MDNAVAYHLMIMIREVLFFYPTLFFSANLNSIQSRGLLNIQLKLHPMPEVPDTYPGKLRIF